MADTASVFRRKVFYIAGFDPRGAGFYHRLYREHAALQSSVTDVGYEVSARRKLSEISHVWHVNALQGERKAETDFEFLSWNDIIRREWDNSALAILRDMGSVAKAYLVNGLFLFYGRHAPKRLIAGFYPYIYILLSVLLSAWAGWWASSLTKVHILSLVLFLLSSTAVFNVLVVIGEKMAVFWIQRIISFGARWAQGKVAGIDDRARDFAGRVTEALREGYDEILLVSHSVGCMLAVPVMAEVLRRTPEDSGKLSMLTLGHCIPLISFHPQAEAYRRDLDRVAHSPRISWLDYTAKTDGACFPLLDFVAASGIERKDTASLKIMSPRFFKLYTPKNYRRLRFNWYKMHFLYLLSTDYAGGYDYFSMTAGTAPLSVPGER